MALPKIFRMNGPRGQNIEIPVPGYGTARDGKTEPPGYDCLLASNIRCKDYEDWGQDGTCKRDVLNALRAGYRHIDCAGMYGVCDPLPHPLILSRSRKAEANLYS